MRSENYWQKYYQKNKEKIRIYQRKWDSKHKEKRSLYRRKHQRYLKKWLVEKLQRKCSRCGLVSEYDCIYDIHHLENSQTLKWINESYLRYKQIVKWKRENKIPEDIILVCANCHRIIEFEKVNENGKSSEFYKGNRVHRQQWLSPFGNENT